MRRAAVGRVRWWAAGLCALSLAPSVGVATEVTVTVSGVRGGEGTIACALFADADGFLQDGGQVAGERAPAAPGSVVVVFENVPPGTYAISAYHDANDNGRLDTNFLGLPAEGVAFSNGQRPTMAGPPTFEAAKVVVGAEPAAFTLVMNY